MSTVLFSSPACEEGDPTLPFSSSSLPGAGQGSLHEGPSDSQLLPLAVQVIEHSWLSIICLSHLLNCQLLGQQHTTPHSYAWHILGVQ